MAHLNTGVGVCFGIAGTVTFTGFSGMTHYKESADFEHDYQLDEVRDDDNEIQGLVHSGGVIKATILFTPKVAAASYTSALPAALGRPTKGVVVTLASFTDTTLNTSGGFQWCYVGGWKMAYKKNGVATYSLNIMASENAAVSIGAAVT